MQKWAKFNPPTFPKDLDPERLTSYEKFLLLNYYNWDAQLHADDEFELVRANASEGYLQYLVGEISEGRINGVRELVLIATRATQLLNKIADQEPRLIAVVAREYDEWPILWNGHHLGKQHKHLLEKIGVRRVGKVYRRGSEPGFEPKPSHRVAQLLLANLTAFRRFGNKELIETDDWIFHSGRKMFPPPMLPPERCSELCKKAESLPDFTRKTAPAWWTVARELLLYMTDGKPWELPLLREYAPTSARKGVGERRDEICKIVKSAFLRLPLKT